MRQLKSLKHFELKKIFIQLNFFIVKRTPETTIQLLFKELLTASYLRANCWGVRYPCDR